MILFKFKIDIMLELISSSDRHMILCEKRRRQRTSQESESDKGKKTKSMSSWSILLQALGSSGIGRKNEKGAKRPLPLRGSGPSGTLKKSARLLAAEPRGISVGTSEVRACFFAFYALWIWRWYARLFCFSCLSFSEVDQGDLAVNCYVVMLGRGSCL